MEACGEAAARGPEGEALVLHIPRGAGHIWYLTGTPDGPSLHALLDRLFAKAGVARPLQASGVCGSRVPGLEARLVRRKHDDLVYLANGSGAPLEFSVETDRAYSRIRELRSLEYYGKAEGVLEKDQVLLFSLQADPARAV
ncbi:MAG TPA: hypothetical protein PKE04_04745 [Clostridia bacterium]|nr:hypothetical protein [Clostridia bacterium]